MCRHGNSLNTSDKPRLAQFISMSPTPRDVTPAERKDSAAERVRKWSEKVVGLGNAPGDARPDPYEARTPAAHSLHSLVPVGGAASAPRAALLCLEGTQAQVTNRLAQLQEGNLAALWHGASVLGVTCHARGFTAGGARDACYSELAMWYSPLTLPAYPGVPQTDEANLYQYAAIVTGVLVGRDFDLHLGNGTSAKSVCQRNFTSSSFTAGCCSRG